MSLLFWHFINAQIGPRVTLSRAELSSLSESTFCWWPLCINFRSYAPLKVVYDIGYCLPRYFIILSFFLGERDRREAVQGRDEVHHPEVYYSRAEEGGGIQVRIFGSKQLVDRDDAGGDAGDGDNGDDERGDCYNGAHPNV